MLIPLKAKKMKKEKGLYIIISKVIVTTINIHLVTNKNTYTFPIPEDLLEDELTYNLQEQFFK